MPKFFFLPDNSIVEKSLMVHQRLEADQGLSEVDGRCEHTTLHHF